MKLGTDRRRFLALLAISGLGGCGERSTGEMTPEPSRTTVRPTETDAATTTASTTDPAQASTSDPGIGSGAWPRFQHDAQNTGHSADIAGPKQDVEARWQFDTGDHLVRSSPVIADRTVYVGAGPAVYALDLESGEKRWRVDVDAPVIAAPTAVDNAIYAVSRVGTAYRLDAADGRVRWRYRSGIDQQAHRPAAPAVGVDHVVFGTSNGLLAVDRTTGRKAWSALTTAETGVHGAVEATPGLQGDVLYVGHASGMYALSQADGAIIWRTPMEAHGVASSPAVTDADVFVGARDGNVYRFDRESGDRLGRYENEFDPTLHEEVSNEITTSPAVADGVVYAGSEDFHAYAWDVDTGERRWRHTVGGRCYTSPAIVDGVVHVGGIGSILWGLDAETGDVKWSYEATDQLVDSSPAVVEGVVVIGDGAGVLHAIVEAG